MKRLLVMKKFIIALCLGALVNTTQAQNDADPAITSFSFAASPIPVNATTNLTVFFMNTGFTTSLRPGSVGLKVSLPTSTEYKAFPESVSSLSGTFAAKFSWTYNAGTRTFIGVNNQDIAAGAGGTIVVSVKGYTPVASRISVASIIRYNPGAYPNENTNNNNLTASLGVVPGFTAGKLSGNTAINVFPNPTTDMVYISAGSGGDVVSVTLYNNDGKQMVHISNFTGGNSIDMRNYGPGMYILKIVDKNGNSELKKVVKQ